MIKGNDYNERIEFQLSEWVKGNSIHNDIDCECCPDFSCCKPHLKADEQVRIEFSNANEEKRLAMLFDFLGKLLESENIEIEAV